MRAHNTPSGRSDPPGEQPTYEQPPEDLGALLNTAVAVTHRRMRTASEYNGLSYGALSVLNRLRRAGPQSVAELARWEGVSAAAMSPTITRVLEGGFAERVTEGPTPRRVLIRVTAKGTEAAVRWVDTGTDWIDSALADVTDEDRATLRRAARLLLDIAGS